MHPGPSPQAEQAPPPFPPPLPVPAPRPAAAGAPRARDLLQLRGEAFVEAAYRALLGRAPDPVGAGQFLEALRHRRLRPLDVLRQIRFSPEGRQRGARLPGLMALLVVDRLGRVPLAGTLVRFAVGLAGLPSARARAEAEAERAEELRDRLAEQVNALARAAAGAAELALRRSGEAHGLALRTLQTVEVQERTAADLEGRLDALEARRARGEEALRRDLEAVAAAAQEDRKVAGDGRAETLERLAALSAAARGAEEEAGARLSALRDAMDRQTATVSQRLLALDGAVARLGAGLPSAPPPLPASLYEAVQERFRGPEPLIRQRLSFYLPRLRAAVAETGAPRVLDLGCGRGELLALLGDEGVECLGVDSSPCAVAACRGAGLPAVEADALAFLRAASPGSWGAITALHLLEHLAPADAAELVALALRALADGGLFVAETPNPANLLVATSAFHLDPTHGRPIPSEYLRFLVERAGFCSVEVVPLHPFEEALPSAGVPEPFAARLNDLLYGPRDYAVLAVSAGGEGV